MTTRGKLSCSRFTQRWALWMTCVAVHASVPMVRADDWPSFRGPNFDGVSGEKLSFGESDAIALEVAWKRPLGSGYSGIALVGDRLVTMFSESKSDFVIALREKDGSELWRYDLGPTYAGHDGSHTGPIATPAIAGNRVLALGPRGNLVALQLDSGELLWKADLPADFKAPTPMYGFGASPLIVGGVLIVAVGGESALAGLDPGTGKVLWRAGKGGMQYQTPARFEWKNKPHLLAASDKFLFCVEPGTGETAWEVEHGGNEQESGILTPIPLGGPRVFMNSKRDASVLVDLIPNESGVELKQVWEEKSLRSTFNLPILYREHLYGYCSRFLTCVEPATAKQLWRSRAPGDGFTLIVDGRMIVLTKEGSVHLAAASPAGYEELASAAVFGDLAWTPPSFANGRLYARSLGEIARVDLRPATREVQASERPTADAAPGTRLRDFLQEVAAATDKGAVVDKFMSSIDSFPLLESPDIVHFIYRGPASDMAVAGDFLGARQERSMQHVEGTDVFYYSTRLEPEARSSYVFYEDFRRLLDPKNPRKAQIGIFTEDMDMSFTGAPLEMSWLAMPKWRLPKHLEEPSGPRGRVESHELDSAALGGKHTIDVYLPAGYEADDRRYPVLYVHGGDAARRDGRIVESLDNLIGKTVQPVLAVLLRGGSLGQPKYSEMFGKELIPFVDGKYRTIATAETRANFGGGFSAFDATLCTFKNPGTAAKLAVQSLFIFEFLRVMLEPLPTASDMPLTVHIEWGRYDLRNPHEAWDIRTSDAEFVKELRDKGFKVSGGEVLDGTGWPSWRNRTNVVLEALFPMPSNSP